MILAGVTHSICPFEAASIAFVMCCALSVFTSTLVREALGTTANAQYTPGVENRVVAVVERLGRVVIVISTKVVAVLNGTRCDTEA